MALLSGELEVSQRADVIKRFRDGKEKVLITTNVSARGTWQAFPISLLPDIKFYSYLPLETNIEV